MIWIRDLSSGYGLCTQRYVSSGFTLEQDLLKIVILWVSWVTVMCTKTVFGSIIQIEACLFKHHFYRRSHSKMASKEHCMYIKQKQNISSQSFLRSPLTLKSSYQFVWLRPRRTLHYVPSSLLCWAKQE